MLPATNLKDYENRLPALTTAETRLGVGANNNLLEVEAALSKDNIAQPYVNNADTAIHFFTFPTKLTIGCGLTMNSPYFNQNADAKSCIDYQVRTYDLTELYPKSGSPFSGGDTSQGNLFCDEVNFLSAKAFEFAEGWAVYDFYKPDNASQTFTSGQTYGSVPLGFDGTPVIPTFAYIGASGLTASYAAWSNDLVYCSVSAVSTLADYQYSDQADCGDT
jgi:hypothetical protein